MTRPGELDIDRQLREARERNARLELARILAEQQLAIAEHEIERLRGIIAEMVKVAEKVRAEA
jgi:hypothetical protein